MSVELLKLGQDLLREHAEKHRKWLLDGRHMEGVDPVALYGTECRCDNCSRIRKGTWNTVYAWYAYQPAFCVAVDELFPEKGMSEEELSRLYKLWEDGVRMGRYCEATKDAEGS